MQTQSVTYLKRDSAPSSYHDLLELAQDGNTTASCPHDRRVAGEGGSAAGGLSRSQGGGAMRAVRIGPNGVELSLRAGATASVRKRPAYDQLMADARPCRS